MQASDNGLRSPQLDVLLVEDNPVDVLLFKQTLRRSAVSYTLSVASDGAEATEMLQQRCHSSLPDVVFLDLNLPCKSGAEILAYIKAHAILARVPVAILTGSEYEDDFAICMRLGADAYFHKAAALNDFFSLAREIEAFLLRTLCPA